MSSNSRQKQEGALCSGLLSGFITGSCFLIQRRVTRLETVLLAVDFILLYQLIIETIPHRYVPSQSVSDILSVVTFLPDDCGLC